MDNDQVSEGIELAFRHRMTKVALGAFAALAAEVAAEKLFDAAMNYRRNRSNSTDT